MYCYCEVNDGSLGWDLWGVGRVGQLGRDVQHEARHDVTLLVTHHHLPGRTVTPLRSRHPAPEHSNTQTFLAWILIGHTLYSDAFTVFNALSWPLTVSLNCCGSPSELNQIWWSYAPGGYQGQDPAPLPRPRWEVAAPGRVNPPGECGNTCGSMMWSEK